MIIAAFKELGDASRAISSLKREGCAGQLGCVFKPTTTGCWFRFLKPTFGESEATALRSAFQTIVALNLSGTAARKAWQILANDGALVSMHDVDEPGHFRSFHILEQSGAEFLEDAEMASVPEQDMAGLDPQLVDFVVEVLGEIEAIDLTVSNPRTYLDRGNIQPQA
jgi:hypothetical protein